MTALTNGPDKVGVLRLDLQPGEMIDRSTIISFTFNGRVVLAYPGDTIASALAANGIRLLARSFKYHRPRGLHGYGHSMNAMVQIGNEVSETVWLRQVEDGMVVNSVNVWPSLDHDVMSLTGLGDRFLPVGFYYKTFIKPVRMWPTYEKLLRRAAGLGKLNIEASLVDGFDKQYLHADVVVVGAGPAGLQAALTAAEKGAGVILFDENPFLGGHQTVSGLVSDDLSHLITTVQAHPAIEIYTGTLVAGYFDHNWLFAVRNQRLYKIRAGGIVFATGAEDQPHIFDNNDLPGVMMASAVQRLLHLHGVAPGRRVVVSTANQDGWEVANALLAAGVEVAAVADMRPVNTATHHPFPVFEKSAVVQAIGRVEVVGVRIAPLDPNGQPLNDQARVIPCDCVVLSTHWTPRYDLPVLAGVQFPYSPERREFLPAVPPSGVAVAGRAAGFHTVADERESGRLAAAVVAAACGFGVAPAEEELSALAARLGQSVVRSTDQIRMVFQSAGKRFVDLDEDVTDKDVKDAIAEGYSSIELLKRYSTISMGPSQGKWSSLNTIHLTAEMTGQTIAQTGKTTSRPPVRPIKMGHLAGQMMEPVRLTPLHDWHVAQGAKMMVAGLWMRPEHYGDPYDEVQAVRQRVGLIDISTLGKIKLTGPGVGSLLDKIYINKFSDLKVGRVRYGIMCTAEGVIMDDGVTARISDDEWYMTTTSSGADRVFEWLQWWIQSGWGDGVHAISATEGRAAFNLAGPQSRALLSGLTDDDLSGNELPFMRVRDFDLAGAPCRLMRIGFTGELSYEIHVPASRAQAVWDAIMEMGRPFSIAPFGVEAQRVLRLEKGHIIVGQDTDALTDPLSADMGWAVKMNKPDFLGKRSISRIAESGIKQKLVGFKMADGITIPEEGLQIVREVDRSEVHPLGLKITGWVTSSRYSPTLGEPIGLCWLPAEVAVQNGASFKIRRRGELIEGRVHHGPFYEAAVERK